MNAMRWSTPAHDPVPVVTVATISAGLRRAGCAVDARRHAIRRVRVGGVG